MMSDIEHIRGNPIGYRAWEEARRVYGSCIGAADSLLLNIQTIYFWHTQDTTPNARILADMCKDGCDVIYILTGKRSVTCKKASR